MPRPRTLTQRIVDVIDERPGSTAIEISIALDHAKVKSVYKILMRLHEQGRVTRDAHIGASIGIDRLRWTGTETLIPQIADLSLPAEFEDAWKPAVWVHPYRARTMARAA